MVLFPERIWGDAPMACQRQVLASVFPQSLLTSLLFSCSHLDMGSSPCHFSLPSQEIVLVWYKLGSASYRLGLCSVSQDHKCQRLKYSYLIILKQSDKGSPYLRSIQDNKYQFKNICLTFLFLLTLASCN